jgi:hypothetical protein
MISAYPLPRPSTLEKIHVLLPGVGYLRCSPILRREWAIWERLNRSWGVSCRKSYCQRRWDGHDYSYTIWKNTFHFYIVFGPRPVVLLCFRLKTQPRIINPPTTQATTISKITPGSMFLSSNLIRSDSIFILGPYKY